MANVEDFLVDFSKEEKTEGSRILIDPGRYHAKIVKAKPTVSDSKGTAGLALTIKLLSGPGKGKTFVETLWISPKALGRFRNLLEAIGANVPKTVNALKIGKAALGKELAVDIVTQKDRSGDYDPKSVVDFNDGFRPLEDLEQTDNGIVSDDDDLGLGDLNIDADEPEVKGTDDDDLSSLNLDDL